MKNYYASYTILINGATWGCEEYEYEASNNKQAVKMALKYEDENSTRKSELLLDYIVDQYGNEIEYERG